MGGTRLRGRVAAALLVGAGALALVLSTLPAPAAASSTTITVLAGSATVTNGSGSWSAASGDLVRPGDQVRTSADGHAVLTFVDGSTMVIEPAGSLVLEEATLRQGSVAVRVFQSVGLTWSSVSRLLAAGSRFEVRTPAITASVRGTAFEVEVAADGRTRVRTSEGTVAVTNAQGEVIVGEGAETTTDPGSTPSPPEPPPPSTRRILEIGVRAVLIVDATGRGCGVYAGKVVQQIPGCVVRDGSIEIRDTERLGGYRLAVTEDVGSDTTLVERTMAAGPGAVESVRVLKLPPAELGASPIQVASGGRAVDLTLPLVGTVPVQVGIPTARPVAPVSVAATASPSAMAEVPLTPLPLPAPTSTVIPTTSPVTLSTPSPLATLSLVPTPTVAPTPAPTAEPTPTPTPILTVPPLLTSPTPTPTPEPTAEPTPTPTPTPVPPPAAPTNLSAVAGTAVPLVSVTVDLSWTASPSADVTLYEIYRSVGGGDFTLLNTSAVTTYSDLVTSNGTYAYKVRAVAADLQTSGFSNTGTITITL